MKRIVDKAHKFRVYPKKDQVRFFAEHFGCTRFIYNHLLNAKKEAYSNDKISLSTYDLKRMIAPLKKQEDYLWLRGVNSQSLQEACLQLGKAYDRFFKHQGGYPSFKKKGNKNSFSVPQHFKVDTENGHISIPKLKTPIKIHFHKSLKNVFKINCLIFSQTPSGKYFVSISVKEKIEANNPISKITKNTKSLGIDLGLTDFLIDSDGNKSGNPRFYKKAEKKLKKAQRKLSRMKKGSSNRRKQRLKVARLHEKISNKRSDFLHKLSQRLTHENQVVCIEDLHVKGMLKNRYLAKSITDAGWGEFTRQLKYKADWSGCTIIQIGRFEASSKPCSVDGCVFVNQTLPLSIRNWVCPLCGTHHDRDINAAINIRKIGLDKAEFKSVEKPTAVLSAKIKQVGSVKQKPSASSDAR
jgi:putative transposase